MIPHARPLTRGRRAVALASSLLGLAAAAPPARAVDYYWNAPSGGLFRTPASWTPFSVPFAVGPGGASDTVHFALGDSAPSHYSIDNVFGQNAALEVDRDFLTLKLAADYTLTTDAGTLPSFRVGNSTGFTGDLTIAGNDAAVLRTQSAGISLQHGFGSVAVRHLDWIAAGEINVGVTGSGYLDVGSTATVSTPVLRLGQFGGSQGGVSVYGAGSAIIATDLIVGASGPGDINVGAGASLTTTTALIGDGGSFTSTATVSDAGSNWYTTDLFVGGNSSSDGTVTVSRKGALTVTRNLRIETYGVLELDDGTLTTPALVDFGGQFHWTAGTLHLTSLSGLEVGVSAFFQSSVALGPAQNLQVDRALKIDAGKSLFAQGGLSAGSVTISAGGQLFTGAPAPGFGTGLTNAGDLVFTATASVASPITNLATGRITTLADVRFNGAVQGPGNFYGAGRVTFAGGYSPASGAPAAVSFEGPVTLQSTNDLVVEIAGAAAGQYDSLHVAGDLALGGTLNVTLLDAFQPQRGQQFLIAAVDGPLTGHFANLTEGARVGTFGGVDLFISYAAGDGNDVSLFTTAVPEPVSLLSALPAATLLLTRRRRSPDDRAPRPTRT